MHADASAVSYIYIYIYCIYIDVLIGGGWNQMHADRYGCMLDASRGMHMSTEAHGCVNGVYGAMKGLHMLGLCLTVRDPWLECSITV